MAVRTNSQTRPIKPKVTTGDREVDERQPVFKNFDDRTEKHPRASILSHFGDVAEGMMHVGHGSKKAVLR